MYILLGFFMLFDFETKKRVCHKSVFVEKNCQNLDTLQLVHEITKLLCDLLNEGWGMYLRIICWGLTIGFNWAVQIQWLGTNLKKKQNNDEKCISWQYGVLKLKRLKECSCTCCTPYNEISVELLGTAAGKNDNNIILSK